MCARSDFVLGAALMRGAEKSNDLLSGVVLDSSFPARVLRDRTRGSREGYCSGSRSSEMRTGGFGGSDFGGTGAAPVPAWRTRVAPGAAPLASPPARCPSPGADTAAQGGWPASGWGAPHRCWDVGVQTNSRQRVGASPAEAGCVTATTVGWPVAAVRAPFTSGRCALLAQQICNHVTFATMS